jgi:hypothetical protein
MDLEVPQEEARLSSHPSTQVCTGPCQQAWGGRRGARGEGWSTGVVVNFTKAHRCSFRADRLCPSDSRVTLQGSPTLSQGADTDLADLNKPGGAR